MNLTDPRLRVIRHELNMKMSPVLAVAALAQSKPKGEGLDLAAVAAVLEAPVDAIRPLFDRIMQYLATDEAGKKQKKSTMKPRHPLADDWKPSELDIAYALEWSLHPGEIDTEAAKFLEYWNRDGRPMADWPATWKNWVKRAAENRNRTRKNPVVAKEIGGGIGMDTWRAAVRAFQQRQPWPRSLGPEPGQNGCRVPPDILREFMKVASHG